MRDRFTYVAFLALALSAPSAWAWVPSVTIDPCADPPLARVGSFTAQSETGGVRLRWYTTSEANTASFQVRRSSSLDGSFTPVGEPVLSDGTPTSGTHYEVLDPGGVSGAYYQLVETDTFGHQGLCAPLVMADETLPTITPLNLQVTPGENHSYQGSTTSGPPYDALIICQPGPIYSPSMWADSLAVLRNHWESFRHLSTALVTMETATPKETIRSWILGHAQARYLLLVGGTHTIPSWDIWDDDLETTMSTDAPYADRNFDGLADFAVGRLPAHKLSEAMAYVRKSIDYDLQSPNQEYRRVWTGFTFDENFIGVSGSYARLQGNDLLSVTPWTVQGQQYRASDPCCRTDTNREAQLINSLNSGTHLVWALGTNADTHSMVRFLDNGDWIGTCDAIYPYNLKFRPLNLNLIEENRAYNFWFPLSCHLGAIDQPYRYMFYDCERQVYLHPIADDLLFSSKKGALTWFAPSRASYQNENHLVARSILTQLTRDNLLSVGEVCALAAKSLAVARPEASQRAAGYRFLGDPTIIMSWTNASTDANMSYSVNRLRVDPNPARNEFRFSFRLTSPEEVTLTVYDAAGRRVRSLRRGALLPGIHHERWNSRDDADREVAAGVYIIQLRTGKDIYSQKIVLMK